MKGRYSSNDVSQFVVAGWDEVDESERAFPVVWRFSVTRDHSKRVLGLTITVVDRDKLPLEQVLVRTVSSWPNASVGTWEAFWYQQCHKTARQVEATCAEVVRYAPARSKR